MFQDLRYGLRMLLKHKGFTAVAALTLALGIGANTAIFSVVNAVLLHPLPYREADRLMVIWETSSRNQRSSVTAPNYLDWRDQNRAFEQIAAAAGASFNLTGGGDPQRLPGARVSANYFDVLGTKPVAGRSLLLADDQHGADRVVLLSYGLWQRRFGADPHILGQAILLDGEPHVVVGVMPEAIRFQSTSAQLWKPLALSPQDLAATGSHYLRVTGRLKPGVTREQAEAELKAIATQLEAKRPHSNTGWSVAVVPLRDQLVSDVRLSLFILLGAVGFVLLIACANIANLLLARAAARRKEMAVRLALGAGRWRLFRQLVTESVILAGLGGAVGLLLALLCLEMLVALLPGNIPRLGQVGIDSTVLGFTLGIALLTGLLFGLAPGLQASKPDLQDALKESGRATAGPDRHRLRSALVVAEVAVTLVLLVGAGLMVRSFWRLQAVNPGFNPGTVFSLQMALPESRYPEPRQTAAFYQTVLEQVTALPDVQSAALCSQLPLGSRGFGIAVFIEGRPRLGPREVPMAHYRAVSADYFRVLRIPQVAGRWFNERDREGAVRVGIINETMARRYWSGEDPLGKRFTLDDNETTPIQIVGVVRDVKHFGLEAEAGPEFFVPHQQAPALFWRWVGGSLHLVVQPRTSASSVLAGIRRAIWSTDAQLPLYNVTSLERLLAESIGMRRVYMWLLAVFAVLALLLGAVGIYGVMTYTVSQRTHEIGIRMALGAQQRDVVKLVVKQGTLLTLTGTVIGLISAFVLTRVLSSLLFGVTATDPATFAMIPLLLVAVALLACYFPARRAAKVDPMVALRYE